MRSWLNRDSLRTRRPSTMIGTTASGTTSSASAVRRGLVISSIARPPTNISELRIATETVEPTTWSIKVVSDDSRLITSPVRAVSNQAGLSRTMCAKAALRISATTRSPSHETK